MYEITHISPSQLEEEPVKTTQINYTKRVDFFSDSIIYKGEAVVGSIISDPSWRIRKIIMGTDDDVEELWADGNDNFDNIWNDRLTLTYI